MLILVTPRVASHRSPLTAHRSPLTERPRAGPNTRTVEALAEDAGLAQISGAYPGALIGTAAGPLKWSG